MAQIEVEPGCLIFVWQKDKAGGLLYVVKDNETPSPIECEVKASARLSSGTIAVESSGFTKKKGTSKNEA